MSISSSTHSPVAATVAKPLRQRSLLGDAMRRFSRNRLAMVGLAIVTLVVLAALLADLIAPFPYDAVDLMVTNQKPSAAHWMGTDEVGRDVFSRIIFGARISLGVGLAVQAIALFIGVPLGLAAGMLGGKVDFVVMRLVEIMTSIPTLMMALLLIAIFGGGVINVIIAIGLVGWLDTCRLVRAQLLTLRERDYVLAARTIGAGGTRIAFNHLLPNAIGPIIVALTIGIPTAMFAEAGLSFLGLGVNDPIPSWGKMVGNAVNSNAIVAFWWLGVFPTLAIAVTMLGFTFLGDGLRDAFDVSGEK